MARTKDLRDKHRTRNREYLRSFLERNPCVDCGNSDVRVLHLDHRDPSTKEREVSQLVQWGFALTRIQAEIEKCDVRCANCHAIRTYAQRMGE